MTFFYDVHRNLLAGAIGDIMAGWLGVATHDALRGAASTTVRSWLGPPHDASVGGLAGRLLGVIIGFAPLWRRLARRSRALVDVAMTLAPGDRDGR